MAIRPANPQITTVRSPERSVGADDGDGAEARIRSSRGWRRLIRGTLVVLAQAAGTLFVLGVLSGTARADVAGSHVVETQDQLVSSRDLQAGTQGQMLEAGAPIDVAGATVDVTVAATRASVAVDETDISFSIERTHAPEQVDGSPARGPRAARAIVAAGLGTLIPRATEPTTSTHDVWFSISAAAGQQRAAATSPRHPLGQQLHAMATIAGTAATSSEDRPDVLGLLAPWSLPLDRGPRPLRSGVTVLTSELVASTGPPG